MKRKLTNNLTFKILSVVFAVILWLTVMNIEDPNKTVTVRGIKVQVLNETELTGNAQVYEIKSGSLCDVMVTGPRSIVDSLSSEDFVATADFTELSQTNAIPIKVTLSDEKAKYENKLTITQNTYTMKINVEKVISKEYVIEVVLNGQIADKHQMGDYETSIDTVTITGPESIIASIEEVKAIADISKLGDNLDVTVGFSLYNTSGELLEYTDEDITLSHDSVRITAEMYDIKEVPVIYEIQTGIFAEYIINGSSINKPNVKVWGKEKDIKGLSQIVIPQELLDMENISESDTFVIKISELLPNGVNASSGYEKVTITVDRSKIKTKKFTISLEDVMIKKIPDGYEASITDTGNITVTLKGADKIVDTITVESLLPYVDLTGAVIGTNPFAVHLTLPDGIEMTEAVTIMVTVDEKETETETGGNDINPGEDETTEPGANPAII